jgi:DNA-directed RNA polymerase sigma subunit (sigma70/sigma32)
MAEFGPDLYPEIEDADLPISAESCDTEDISANCRQFPSAPATQAPDINPAADHDLDAYSNTTFFQDQPISVSASTSPLASTADSSAPPDSPEESLQEKAVKWITNIFNPTRHKAKLLLFLSARLNTPTTIEEICATMKMNKKAVHKCGYEIHLTLKDQTHPFIFISNPTYLLKPNPACTKEDTKNPDIKYTEAQKSSAIAWAETHFTKSCLSKEIAIFLANNLGSTITVAQVAKALHRTYEEIKPMLKEIAYTKYKNSPYQLLAYNKMGNWRLIIRENQPIQEFSDIPYENQDKTKAAEWVTSCITSPRLQELLAILIENMGSFITTDIIGEKITNLSKKSLANLVLALTEKLKQINAPYQIEKLIAQYRLVKILGLEPLPSMPESEHFTSEAIDFTYPDLETLPSIAEPAHITSEAMDSTYPDLEPLPNIIQPDYPPLEHSDYLFAEEIPLNGIPEYFEWHTRLTPPFTLTYKILEYMGEKKAYSTFKAADLSAVLAEKNTETNVAQITPTNVERALIRLATCLTHTSPYQITGTPEAGFQIEKNYLSDRPVPIEIEEDLLVPLGDEPLAKPSLPAQFIPHAGGSIEKALDYEINQIPEMSHEDNIRLRILAGPIGPNLKESDLTNPTAFEELVMGNFRLIRYFSKALAKKAPHISEGDLVSAGWEGLRIGCLRFDPSRGSLSTITSWWIQQKMHRAINKTKTDVRRGLHVWSDIRRMQKAIAHLQHNGIPTTRENIGKVIGKSVEQVERLQIAEKSPASLDGSNHKKADGDDISPLGQRLSDGSDEFGDLDRSKHETYLLKELYRAFCTILGISTSKRIPLAEARARVLAEIFDIQEKNKSEIRLRRDLYIYLRRTGIDMLTADADQTGTLEDVGREVGLTRESPRQIELKIYPLIRRALHTNKVVIPSLEELRTAETDPEKIASDTNKLVGATATILLLSDLEAETDPEESPEPEVAETEITKLRKTDLRPPLNAAKIEFAAWKKEIVASATHPVIANTILINLGGLPAGEKGTTDKILQLLRFKEQYEKSPLNKTNQQLLTEIEATLIEIENHKSNSFALTFDRDRAEFQIANLNPINTESTSVIAPISLSTILVTTEEAVQKATTRQERTSEQVA